MTTPRETWSRLSLILGDVVDALADVGAPVAVSTIEPGMVSWDYCCATDDGVGQAFIRVVRIVAAEPFPQQTLVPRSCPPTMAALVEVGVLRCAPTLTSQANAPAPAEVTATAAQVIADMSVVYSVLKGHVPDWALFPTTLDTWSPIGPEGGCAGGAWQAWIDVAICPPEVTSATSPTSP